MRKLTALATAVLAAAGLTATAPSAHAGPGSLYAPSALVLTTARGEGFETAIQRAVTLSCTPRPTGTHPSPAPACRELRQTAGHLSTLISPAGGQPCTKIYAPVTIGVDGVWQGQRISWQHTFANPCEKEAATSGNTVFAF
ncbi:subtilase-type protease inhibitor [Streptomyces sp. NBC_00289]|uniref:subtilase-type protease inhibitor n=1 Tax=Streptomyces sp. NBC_00289 TaxID=2975703 RepID=UPI003243E3C9